jgi:UPF0716 family protein affecting phage T7 exclusion
MLKVLVVVLLAIEAALLVALAAWAGSLVVVCEVLLTALVGILALLWMPARWRNAILLEDQPGGLRPPSRRDVRRGDLLLLAAVLLILPGPTTDSIGLLLLACLAAEWVWRQGASSLARVSRHGKTD